MSANATIILDISTSPLPEAAAYLDVPRAPSNWKDEAKIAAYVAEKTAERLAGAALDLDLCRITGIACLDEYGTTIDLAKDETEEYDMLEKLSDSLMGRIGPASNHDRLMSYNGKSFDWPVLMRRAKYLGLNQFPVISVDRYKSEHVDLLELLSDRDPSRRRSLGFYAKRLKMGLGDKPLDGADEARVPETGQWTELEASLRWDALAIQKLAHWWGIR